MGPEAPNGIAKVIESSVFAFEALFFVSVAAVGGVLGYLMRAFNRGEERRWDRAGLEMMASGFIGFLAMLACKAVELDWHWAGVVVGVLGWLGAEASIVLLSNLIRNRLGIRNDRKDKEKAG